MTVTWFTCASPDPRWVRKLYGFIVMVQSFLPSYVFTILLNLGNPQWNYSTQLFVASFAANDYTQCILILRDQNFSKRVGINDASRVLSNGLWPLQMAVQRDELWQLRLFLGPAVKATEVTKAGKCHQVSHIYTLWPCNSGTHLLCCWTMSLKLLRGDLQVQGVGGSCTITNGFNGF